jgi:hypothetical protein
MQRSPIHDWNSPRTIHDRDETVSPAKTIDHIQSSAAAFTDGESVRGEEAWTLQALRSVWVHQRGRVEQRIAVIERAAVALANDRLDPGPRADAERAAHMLAGSLGMFGYLDASNAARELEAEFAQPSVERAPQLPVLLRRLRDGIEGPVSLCTAE